MHSLPIEQQNNMFALVQGHDQLHGYGRLDFICQTIL